MNDAFNGVILQKTCQTLFYRLHIDSPNQQLTKAPVMNQERIGGEFREGLPFLGGSLWIDFLNTMPVIKGVQQDLIGSPDSLERWARLANIDPPNAGESDNIKDLKELRALLAQAFDELASSNHLSHLALEDVNRRIERSGTQLNLVERTGLPGLEERVTLVGPPVATAVAWDFAQFLGDFDPVRMRRCDNPACTMRFYDSGKNNRRRWCTMAVCGNRDKVAQYRVRKARVAG